MSKLRVYQLAKDLEISSKKLIEHLSDLSIEVKNHMSSLSDEEAEIVIELLTGGKTIIKENSETKKNQVEKTEQKKDAKNINISIKKEEIKESSNKTITVNNKIIVKDFAKLLGKKVNEVIFKLINIGVMASINNEIDYETCVQIAAEYETDVKLLEESEEEVHDISICEDDECDLVERPPVVTVMGHVDHGKTSLLDAIRETKITEKEAGGITQHIGASEVTKNGKRIVFLDTPGHEAFTSMRARGAKVTDIAILVVAADDGVMPQTIEAINHAKAAQVPIIIAINKIDKQGANPDRVKQELSEHGILIEEWGGDVISVEVSALKKLNIDGLLEMILIVAEMEDLKANPKRPAVATVVEAHLDKGRGPVATVLIQNGTLRIGDSVVVGTTCGRVRAMVNDKGRRIKIAGPATAVEINGLSEVPEAGDTLLAVDTDKKARETVEKRKNKIKEDNLKKSQRISLDALFGQMKDGKLKGLNVIVKADVQGSIEAVIQSLNKLSNEEVAIKSIHGGVGAITESDVMLAAASNAIIIGFNVRPTSSATTLARTENVDLRMYRVIYDAINDIESAMIGMLDPEYYQEELGKASVRATFKVPNIGLIAGCYVTEGKILRNAIVRLVRDGIIIHEGSISSLKRFKDDAKEVATGYECGIGIENFNDVKDGDVIEAYQMKEKERKSMKK